MLRCKDLRGRHQHGLIAVFDGDQRSLKRHDGLAAAHIALQKASHGLRPPHVFNDLSKDTFLRARGTKGQDLLNCVAHVFVRCKSDPRTFSQTPALQVQAELQIEELFKNKSGMGSRGEALQVCHGCTGWRKVRLAQGLQARRQTESLADRKWQGVDHRRTRGKLVQQTPHHLPHPSRPKL